MTEATAALRQEKTMAAPLVAKLVESFDRDQVRYSHWKSNIDLARAAAGDTDLDLLIDRSSVPQALAILSQLGFKAAMVRRGENPPGIRHYFGFDPDADRLIHVHLFSRVLTGESYVKSHLLPFEELLLENVYYSGGIRVTSRSAELLLFTLRMFIKYGSLLDLLKLRKQQVNLKEEVCWLQGGSALSPTLAFLETYCPVIDEKLFAECVDTLSHETSLRRRMMLARKVRGRLKGYARHSALQRLLAYVHLLWAEVRRRIGAQQKNKIPQAGGAIIAFVGGEATGKSTLVAETGRWLGSTFAVRSVHVGKPPSTWLTAPFSLLLPLIRRWLSSLRTSRLEGHVASSQAKRSPSKSEGLPSLVYALRAVILAWERRQLLVRSGRAAADGVLVICDRYPSDTVGIMDSPRLRERPAKRGVLSAIFNWMARLEQRLYKQIPPPDIVLRLNVSIATAQRRNRERDKPGHESQSYVASRHRQFRQWHKLGTKRLYDIDTEQSLADTILCVKKAIWESL